METGTVRIIFANQQGVVPELRYVAGSWQMDYNHYQPYINLGYMMLAGFAK